MTSFWSIWISPFQVPMMDMSERAIEATQSQAQPESLNLNLYENDRPVHLILKFLGEGVIETEGIIVGPFAAGRSYTAARGPER